MASKSKSRGIVYGEDGLFRRAGCICLDTTETRVLLVESTRRAGALVIPAGKVEESETDDFAAAALRETEEEAGARGEIVREVEHDFVDAVAGHSTRYFVLRVTALLDPGDYVEGRAGRRRHWVPRSEAVARLRKPTHQEAMAMALGVVPLAAEGARAKAGGGSGSSGSGVCDRGSGRPDVAARRAMGGGAGAGSARIVG